VQYFIKKYKLFQEVIIVQYVFMKYFVLRKPGVHLLVVVSTIALIFS